MAMRVAGSGKKAGAAFGGAVAGAELVLAVGGALLAMVGLALGGGGGGGGGSAAAGHGGGASAGGGSAAAGGGASAGGGSAADGGAGAGGGSAATGGGAGVGGGSTAAGGGASVGGGSAAAGGRASAGGAALLLVVRLALAEAEVVMKEDVCASSTSSPSESSKNYFPTSSAIYVTDRVLKQLVKNLVFTFEFFSREKCAVLRVVGLYPYTCTATFSSCAIILLV